MQLRTRKNAQAGDSLAILSTTALAAFVLAMLYVARDILIPLALATLLTFLLAPMVTLLERFVGRVLAVLVVVTMIFAATGAAGYVLTHQLIDLATRLPDYRENIVGKLHAIQMPSSLRALTRTFEEVRSQIPGATPEQPPQSNKSGGDRNLAAAPATTAAPVARVQVVVSPDAKVIDLIRMLVAPVMGPLGTAALVLLLVICMLLQREDLRRRVIRLVGQGYVGTTTRALDDAGRRVSRYLLMQAVVNVSFGGSVAVGLYFIGVPNAFLFGGLAAVLRFIPYLGAWIAAAIPTALALAVSPGWTMPLLTIGLFVMIETLNNNLMEPWLYGASTGVTPIALIMAAVVWTWLWGPIGLVLATPLTVCMVVLGRHVPRLEFLGVLLSDEEVLTPAEDCYQRLLTPGEHDEMELVESFLSSNPLVRLYDDVLVPVLIAAARDARQNALDEDQLASVEQSLRDIVHDLASRDSAGKPPATVPARRPCRALCVAARAERDELAVLMIADLLRRQGCEARIAGAASAADVLDQLGRLEPDVVVLSVVAPSSVLHARHLCQRIRNHSPGIPILVGLWGGGERMASATRRLREAGATVVVSSLHEAAMQIAEVSTRAALPRPAIVPMSA